LHNRGLTDKNGIERHDVGRCKHVVVYKWTLL